MQHTNMQTHKRTNLRGLATVSWWTELSTHHGLSCESCVASERVPPATKDCPSQVPARGRFCRWLHVITFQGFLHGAVPSPCTEAVQDTAVNNATPFSLSCFGLLLLLRLLLDPLRRLRDRLLCRPRSSRRCSSRSRCGGVLA